jgi:glutathione peroxidase
MQPVQTVYDFSVPKIDGKSSNIGEFKGKVLLLVNVASKCGLTPQYEGLEKLYQLYKDKGFEILGFPANEFGAQEPGTNAEIQEFCQMNFGVKFPMYQKIAVKGADQHPLYTFLTKTKPEAVKPNGSGFEEKLAGYGIKRENKSDILWNFEKFLVGRDGKIVARFSPDTTPEDPTLKKAIEAALG